MKKTISKSKSKKLTKTTSASSERYRDNTLVNLWKPAANLIRKMHSLFRLLRAWMKIWALILNPKLILTPVFQLVLIQKLRLRLTQSRNNWSPNRQTHPRIIRMICNCRFPWRAETMPYIWELSIWAHQWVSQHALYSILGLSTWPWQAHCVMIKHQAISSSKSMTHFRAHLFREISSLRDAERKLTIWKSRTLTKFYPRHRQSWPMGRPSCRASSGRTTLAFSP